MEKNEFEMAVSQRLLKYPAHVCSQVLTHIEFKNL